MAWGAVVPIVSAIAGGAAQGLTSRSGGGGSLPTPSNPFMQQLKFLSGKAKKNPRPGDIFGTQLKDTLSKQLADPYTLFPGTNQHFLDTILGNPNQLMAAIGSPDQFASRIANFNTAFQDPINTARQFNANGMPTDGSAYFDEAIRQLNTRAIPNAAEVAGLGVQSSGFANAAGQASSDLLGQASLANIDLAEAARSRQLQASPLLAGLLTSQQAIPEQLNQGRLGLTKDLYNLFNTENNRSLNLFQGLFGMGANSGQYMAPGYNPTDSAAGYAAAGGGISGILNALSNFKSNPSTPLSGGSSSNLNNVLSNYGQNTGGNFFTGGSFFGG